MEIKYELDTQIKKPLKEVVKVFADRSRYKEWQPGLLESELTTRDPHPTYALLMQFGRRKMKMTETILEDALPASYTVKYVTKGVENTVHISFEAIDERTTKYISRETFRFKGLMKLFARSMQEGFKKQSSIIMNNFRRYVENT